TDEHAEQRRDRIARQLAGDQVLPPLPRHLRGRRKDGRADVGEATDRFPDGERAGDDGDGPERLHFTPRVRFASRSRSRRTNSVAFGVFAILPTPYFDIRSAVICT